MGYINQAQHNVSETGFCFRFQVEPTQLGPIDRASPYLQTPEPTQDGVYKPSTAQRFGDWVLFPSSGGTYSVGLN
jgi:hypothetical protein